MKKVVLFALLLAAVTAASARAVNYEPQWGSWYYCNYSNYSGNANDPGFSKWVETSRVSSGSTLLIRTNETFTAPYGYDTYKAAWAKPQPGPYGASTIWEFTFNPDGPQCKRTVVSAGGYTISFEECTDGHSRFCSR